MSPRTSDFINKFMEAIYFVAPITKQSVKTQKLSQQYKIETNYIRGTKSHA